MGSGQSQAQKLQTQRKLNKPQLPQNQHQTPDQQYNFLISQQISRYIWSQQFEYESLIYEIVTTMSIKRYSDYFQYFKPHMRYIKKAEKLYNDIVQCCLYESKWNDDDKLKVQGVLVLLFNLYHIEKYIYIFNNSSKIWWEGNYFDILKKHIQYVEIENVDFLTGCIQVMIEYFIKRYQEIKPQNENKKVDLASVRVLADYYLTFLYKDVVTYLTDQDISLYEYINNKQDSYMTLGREKLNSNVKILTQQQKLLQQQLYQQQLKEAGIGSRSPSQQIEDMERQFKFLSDHSIKEETEQIQAQLTEQQQQ